jgi:hypothetical protein
MPEPQTSQTPPVDFSDLGGKKLQEPPKFDSGKVISVAYPNGDLHSIALPEDTDPAEFHQALSDSGYHFPSTAVKPTREGSLEFNPAFRAQAAAAYGKSLNGRMANREAAFSVGRDGKMSPITVHDSKPGETPTDTFQYNSNDVATWHNHPEANTISGPSSIDIAAAKAAHKVFLISTADGLYSVDPSGAVSQVFKNPDWATAKNPK